MSHNEMRDLTNRVRPLHLLCSIRIVHFLKMISNEKLQQFEGLI